MVSLTDVIELHLADVTFPDGHPLRGQTGEVFGVAIRHGRGLVRFDTGIEPRGVGEQRSELEALSDTGRMRCSHHDDATRLDC